MLLPHPNQASYDSVASEYYNAILHPTCADFRAASRIYLQKLFLAKQPAGKIADIGCGMSLLAEFVQTDLVLVDESTEMLNLNIGSFEVRKADISAEGFGKDEFDWIFAVLADPYNDIAAWANIEKALKRGGRCCFIVPSYVWADKFRSSSGKEKAGFARFDLARGQSVFLPSVILSPLDQKTMINSVGLKLEEVVDVLVSELREVKSPKIYECLGLSEAILNVYIAQK